MMDFRRFWLLCLGSWILCGCTQSPPAQPSASEEPPATDVEVVETDSANGDELSSEPDATATDPAPDVVELQLLEWDDVEDLIASHRGKVVVVDLWATYCAPCRREFPGLVALSREHPDSVACVSVSLDDVDDRDAALEFLQEQNATIDNVLCTTDLDTLYDEILKIGAIPAIYVYGPDGEVRQRFVGPAEDGSDHTYDGHIVPFVEELLNEG